MAPWIDFEKIKREADFAKVLRHYGLEFPEGRTQLKLRCPFHEDGTPSLSVNLAEKVWHCFGCGERGNVFRFVECMEALGDKRPSTRQAAVRVAAICGLTDYETERPVKGRAKRPETTVRAGSGPETTERPSGAQALLPAAPTASEAHAEASEAINPPLTFALRLDPTHPYMAERGLAPATVEAFGLGYSSRGMMKGRVCVPIHNERGELVAYDGRWIGSKDTLPEGEGKWKQPPKFQKHRVLYNLHRVAGRRHLAVVESYWAVFRLHTLDVPAVALMDSALSAEHVDLLRGSGVRFVTVLLDGDQAGRAAAERIVPALARAFWVRDIVLPDGAQPDTMNEAVLQALLAGVGRAAP